MRGQFQVERCSLQCLHPAECQSGSLAGPGDVGPCPVYNICAGCACYGGPAPATVAAEPAGGKPPAAEEKKEDDSDNPFGAPHKKTASAAVGKALYSATLGKLFSSGPKPRPVAPRFAPKP